MINGKTHYKWPFSIAMLNYQRVYKFMMAKNACDHQQKTNTGLARLAALGDPSGKAIGPR
jgi:hypothetical protein